MVQVGKAAAEVEMPLDEVMMYKAPVESKGTECEAVRAETELVHWCEFEFDLMPGHWGSRTYSGPTNRGTVHSEMMQHLQGAFGNPDCSYTQRT